MNTINNKPIKKVAVIGAGVMGQAIASHMLNASLDCLLLDLADKGSDKNALLKNAVKKIQLAKPSLIFEPSLLNYLKIGNLEDNIHELKDYDLIIEAVIENNDIKKNIFKSIIPHLSKDAIVASNTSGLSVKKMLDGFDSNFTERFLVMHFFNPVRYLHLLEIIPSEFCRKDIVERVRNFGTKNLGKGVILAKDTPNFIANRIGVYGMMETMSLAIKQGYSIEEIDAIFGKILGRPKSAIFRTADVVGLDTFVHVAQNCYDNLPNDECHEVFKIPNFLQSMIKNGWLGQKTNQGFYKKSSSEILALDLQTLTYRPLQKIRFDSLGACKNLTKLEEKINHVAYADDKAQKIFFDLTAKICVYAANRLGEIADNIQDIDNAMEYGFGWQFGPFKTWDSLGVKKSLPKIKELGLKIPTWVEEMLSLGFETFYIEKNDGLYSYCPNKKSYQPIVLESKEISINALRKTNIVKDSDNYSLVATKNDCLIVEFNSKMNAIDNDILNGINHALDLCEDGKFKALILYNEGENFSVGANLLLLYMAAMEKMWTDIENIVKNFQHTSLRLRYSSVPTVSAPFSLTLGGGCELSMWCNAVCAQAETYMGLVEVGVGLIPGGGGNVEMIARSLDNAIDSTTFITEGFIQRALETVAMGKVATSALEAKKLLYLNKNDIISMNKRYLLNDADALASSMANSYTIPRHRFFRLPGENAYATFKAGLMPMMQGGFISEHDYKIACKLAYVMTGGKTNSYKKVSEHYLLDLEREAFLSLLSEEKTLARIAYMLEHNKPLRN